MTVAQLPQARSPVRVTARLEAPLSRWLWLVKWLLVVPHLIVLSFLWLAFAVLSVIAFFAILFTATYPRSIFEFNLGVLRWSWRVGYYAYGALGTDRYPPFTLGEVPDYPATLDIAYPQHLVRGMVLVKWLLALPHYVVLAFFVGGGSYALSRTGSDGMASGGGLIGLLVLIAGITLLLTGRYPRGLFDLLLGMHRWVLRVAAYTALMTDQYPPFRLDMGGSEPSALVVSGPVSFEKDAGLEKNGGLEKDAGPVPPSGHWSVGRIIAVVVGSVLLLGGIGTAVGATSVLAADRTGRDGDGFLTTPTQTFTSSGYALIADPLTIGGDNAAPSVGAVVGDVRIHAAAAGEGVFVGIGPADAVEGYLGSVARERLLGISVGRRATQQVLPGGAPVAPPAQQTFWATSVSGAGPQQLTWTAARGEWAVVVMNADGTRPVVVDLAAGATAPWLRWVWIGMYMGAGIGLIAGAALVLLAVRRRRDDGPTADRPGPVAPATVTNGSPS